MSEENTTSIIAELTEREKEILRLVATGTSNKDIAQKLFISSNTVKVHLRNIFAKTGVASRTEAAVFAIQAGLAPEVTSPEGNTVLQEAPNTAGSPINAKQKWSIPFILTIMIIILVISFTTYAIIRLRAEQIPLINSTPTASTPSRWQELTNLPTARSGLAVAVYENWIFAIGGETMQGITGVMEQYDTTTNKWATMHPKPVPVTNINAAVVGGKIYVPGGKLASGKMTDVVESFDPLTDTWEESAALPKAICGYALTAFEGKLYLIGGWDGEHILNSVYEYDPGMDTWQTRAPMTTARDFAGAANAGGKIFVVGGFDGEKALGVNEEYNPDRNTWSERKPLPEARYAMGMTSIADLVYAVGGVGESDVQLPALQYSYQQDQWQVLDSSSTPQSWSFLGLVPLQTHLYGLGGEQNDVPTAHNLSFQAIYTISIPILP